MAKNVAELEVSINALVDRLKAVNTGVRADYQFFRDEIARLQTSPGDFSAEDQATIDRMEAYVNEHVTALEATEATVPPVVSTPLVTSSPA